MSRATLTSHNSGSRETCDDHCDTGHQKIMQAAVIHPSSRLPQLPAGYSHLHGSMASFVNVQ